MTNTTNTNTLEARLAELERAAADTPAARLRATIAELVAEHAEASAACLPLAAATRAKRSEIEASRLALREAEAAHRRLMGTGGKASNALAFARDRVRHLDNELAEVRGQLDQLERMGDAPVVHNLMGRA